MPEPASPQVVRAVTAYIATDARIRERIETLIRDSWRRLGSYRSDDIARWLRTVLPATLGAQRQVAAMTDAYLAQLATVTLGVPTRPGRVRARDVTGQALRGVDPRRVYRRPGQTVWWLLSQGKTPDEAIAAGEKRALSIATTDLQLAKTHTARAVMAGDDRVVGFRRVLTGAENCGLCIVASTQRYHKGDLMPIHGTCDCAVEMIFGDRDPGQVIDPERLEEIHAAIGARFGAEAVDRSASVDSYRSRLVTHTHGEIGPILAVRGQHFTGPSDI